MWQKEKPIIMNLISRSKNTNFLKFKQILMLTLIIVEIKYLISVSKAPSILIKELRLKANQSNYQPLIKMVKLKLSRNA